MCKPARAGGAILVPTVLTHVIDHRPHRLHYLGIGQPDLPQLTDQISDAPPNMFAQEIEVAGAFPLLLKGALASAGETAVDARHYGRSLSLSPSLYGSVRYPIGWKMMSCTK
jgi:hypothetical protein